MTPTAALSSQPTVRNGCFQFTQKGYPIYIDKYKPVPNVSYRFRLTDHQSSSLGGNGHRQVDAFDVDDDAPHVPSADPMSNPQSRRKPVYVS